MKTTVRLEKFSGNNFYFDRKSRYEFLVSEFNDLINGNVLDIGCDEKYLKSILGEKINYTGIDKNNKAEIFMDLEKDSLLSINQKFDTIICTEVLEHLENIHRIFNEILEISRKYIIISLPNAWFEFKKIPILKNSGKFYGLPVETPEDRHRWFFNFSEAKHFIEKKVDGKAEEVVFYPYFNKTNQVVKTIAKTLLSENRYLNLFSPTLWAVIRK